MEESKTEPNLITMIATYLKERDNKTMQSVVTTMQTCLPPYLEKERFTYLAKAQDILGWDCMLKGRIPKLFVIHQRSHLAQVKTRITAKRWAKLLITELLQITHK